MANPENPSNDGRFTKGRTGNPNGRPRVEKENHVSPFEILLDRPVTVTQNGLPQEVSVEEALQHRAYQDAINGNVPAQRVIVKMIIKRDQARAAKGGRNWPRVIRRIEPDPANADAALQILGIATHNSDRDEWKNEREPLLLEPWAVQAALTRRRGGERLRDEEIKTIKRCMRDASKLRRPRGYGE